MRRARTLALLFAGYVVAAKIGLHFAAVHPSATAIWPPTGIALAAFLLWGRDLWPAIFAGAFLANVTTEGSVVTSLGIAAGNTVEAVVGAYLVERFDGTNGHLIPAASRACCRGPARRARSAAPGARTRGS